MIHHEAILAFATLLVAASILVLAALRSLRGLVLSIAPAIAFMTLTAAVTVMLEISINAAMLAGISAAVAVLVACSMLVARRLAASGAAVSAHTLPLRAVLLPPLTLAGAAAPLVISSRPAVAELGAALAMLMLISAMLVLLLVPVMARWLDALTEPRPAARRPGLNDPPRQAISPVVVSPPSVAADTGAENREQTHEKRVRYQVLAGGLHNAGNDSIRGHAEVVFNRGNSADPESLDPHKTATIYEANILRDLFMGLMIQDAKANVQPGAAESFTVSEDGKTYRFKLRQGALWSDGTPVTADDFVFSCAAWWIRPRPPNMPICWPPWSTPRPSPRATRSRKNSASRRLIPAL